MIVRRATEFDLPKLANLEQEVFENDAYSKQSLLEELQQKNRAVFVAEQEGELLGYVDVNLLPDMFEIMKIATQTSMRKKGIATQLLQTCLQQLCKEHNIDLVQLEVKSTNKPAILFYEKMGFEKVYVRKGYYKTCDALVLQKQL